MSQQTDKARRPMLPEINLPTQYGQSSAIIKTETGIILNTEKMEVILTGKDQLTEKGLIAAGEKLRHSFPAIKQGWLVSFFEEVKAEGYSDQELMEVVRKVIREETFMGHPPAIAKFLGYGRKIKLYTMHDIDRLVTEGKEKYQNFGMVTRKEGNAPCAYFAKRSEMKENGIPEVEPRRI